MTIIDLLSHIHRQITEARAGKNITALNEIWRTVDLMLEVAYQTKDIEAAMFLEDMGDDIRDSLMEEEWKGKFPSEENIKKLIETRR